MPVVHSSEVRNRVLATSPAPRQERAVSRAGLRKRIGSVGALYAHALLIEYEAVDRYREFALNMSEHGNDEVAALFQQLAEFEAEHAFHLAKKTAGMSLPKLSGGEHAWLDKDAPVPEAHAFVYRMLTPRMALDIALRAEQRAKAFFDKVLAESGDAGIRELARTMAHDEEAHVAWVSQALAHVPQPYVPGEDFPGDPTIPQQV